MKQTQIKGIKENINKTDTPMLSNSFTVTYDENTPEGCKAEGDIPKPKDYSTFNPVKIEESNLTCEGYKFQGWEVVNKENISMIGNSYFVSDGNNIKLKAIWSKVSLKKSMDGTVHAVNPVLKETPFDEENWIPYQGEFWNDTYKLNTTKIIIQNELNPIEEAVEFWDVSEANDGSVMAFAVLNDDGSTYTIYLQGPGKILANKDSSYLFYEFLKVQTIEGLEYLDTSNVTNMMGMFSDCTTLTELDVSNFDTSNVTDMSSMFYFCENLTELDLSNFDTSMVTVMSSMFYNCRNLTELDLSNFDTSKVTSMNYMFNDCTNLTELDLSNFDTSNVTNMQNMFSDCTNLTNLNLSGFDTQNVTTMFRMFYNCRNLINLDLSSFDMSKVASMNYMFDGCSNLRLIEFRNADFSSAARSSNMFNNTSNLSVIVKDETARAWIQSRLGSNGTAIIASSVLSILLLVTILPNSFASLIPVKSITIESENLSYEENEPGSYKITKSAEWIGKGKARITFQVDTKELIKENTNTDTILIIDISDSMTGNKMNKVKQDSIDLIQKTLQDNNNKIGIIEFNNNASIVSNLSNDVTDLTNKINNLTTLGSTNYYQALVKLDELLKTYQKEENRELTVLFLTDGLPNINTPNEVGQYKYLKSEYPYLNINGIQYEMGNTILEEVKNISDKQYIADMNTLNNVLIDASTVRESYTDFEITDYINTEHFNIEDKEAITATTGKFTLEKRNGKITWNLDGLSSGTSVTMTIDVYLKEEYIDQYNLYETNTRYKRKYK